MKFSPIGVYGRFAVKQIQQLKQKPVQVLKAAVISGVLTTLVGFALSFGPTLFASLGSVASSTLSTEAESAHLALNPDLIFDWGRGDGDCRPGVCRS